MEWKQTEAYYLLSQAIDNKPVVDYCDMAVRSIDVVSALNEIERQREEIAALREQVAKMIKPFEIGDSVRLIGGDLAGVVSDVVKKDGSVITITTKPNGYTRKVLAASYEYDDAAPVESRRPMLGDTLVNAITEGKRIIVKETGERGIVFKIFYSEIIQARQYRVEFTNGEYCDYDRDEIEPA